MGAALIALFALAGGAPLADTSELDVLVKSYLEYGLPLPPADAPLVRSQLSGLWKGNTRTGWGYVLKTAKGKPITIQVGTQVVEAGEHRFDEAEEIPLKAESAETLFLTADLNFPEDAGLALAVIERTRGHNQFAVAILNELKENPFWSPDSARMLPSGSPLARMPFLAFQHWLNEITRPGTDRALIAKRMRGVLESSARVANPPNRAIVEALERATSDPVLLALKPGYELSEVTTGDPDAALEPGRAGSLDASIYGLIAAHGFDAIPGLVASRYDQTLSRAVAVDVNGNRRLLTVGELATKLVHMYTEATYEDWFRHLEPRIKEFYADWWESTKAEGELEVLLKLLNESNTRTHSRFLVRVVEARHPRALPGLLRNRVTGGRGPIEPVVEAILRTKFVKAEASSGLRQALRENYKVEHRLALWALQRIDEPALNEEVEKFFRTPPTDKTERGYAERLLAFASYSGNTDSPLVWNQLEKIAIEADPSLRASLLYMAESQLRPKSKDSYLKLLSAFFADLQFASPSSPGMHAPRLRVQEVAVGLAARCLGIADPLNSSGTVYWHSLRARVKDQLAKASRTSARLAS
jgi:hypothetical protein